MKPKQRKWQAWQRLLLVTLAFTGFSACQTPEEDPLPPQTEILSVDFIPNENLVPGDTVAIRCRIKDSLDTRFNYYWLVSNAEDLGAPIGAGKLIDAEPIKKYWDAPSWLSLNRNTVHWIVPDCTQTFTLIINGIVENGDNNKAIVIFGNSIKIYIN